jgi:hypothetical protein
MTIVVIMNTGTKMKSIPAHVIERMTIIIGHGFIE